MRNYLFLDDNSARHDQFIDFTHVILTESTQKDQVIRHVHSYETAIEALVEKDAWEILFLDHDLGPEDAMCTPGKDNVFKTGTDVAKFIVDKQILIKLIILHSFNPVGRKYMSNILHTNNYKVYEIPFGFPYPEQVVKLLR
jgi:hypothetical protein